GGWLGSITLAQPISVRALTWFAIALVGLVVLFLCRGSYTARTTVDGRLVPAAGIPAVVAPAAGGRGDSRAREGDAVDRGQPLVTVRVPRFAIGSGDTTEALSSQIDRRADSIRRSREASLRQLAATTAGLHQQISATQAELAQIRVEITVRQEQ